MKQNVKALNQFLLDRAQQCVHKPYGNLAQDFVTPTYAVNPGADDQSLVPERSSLGHYLQMYDWDAYFFCQCAQRLGLPDLPLSVFMNFLDLQDNQGYIARTVSPKRIWDKGDLCKPFLCQLLALYCQSLSDADKHKLLTEEIIKKLDHYLTFVLKHRRGKHGLFHWRNVLESGVDNNLALLAPEEAAKDENTAVGNFPDGELLAVDLAAYLVAEFSAFSSLAHEAGNAELAGKYIKLAEEVKALIEEVLWDEHIGMYANYDAVSDRHIPIRSWTGILPVFLDLSSPERREIVIEKNINCPDHFLSPHGLSSLARSELLYNQAQRGLYGKVMVSNWQGPIWVLPNVLATRSLIKCGKQTLASEIASRIINTLASALSESNTLFENYNAETGQPLWAPQFISWNILALELIELIS